MLCLATHSLQLFAVPCRTTHISPLPSLTCLGQARQTMTRPRSLWACPSSLQRTVQADVCCFTVLRKAHSSALRLLEFRFPELKLMADQVLSCSLMCDAFCTQLYSDQHLQQRLCVVSARKMCSHSMRCVSRQIW